MDASVNGNNTNDSLKEAIDNVKSKNTQLRESISFLQKENEVHKLKYDRLKHQLKELNILLEKSVQVLSELFVDTKSALHMCKIPSTAFTKLDSLISNQISVLNSPVQNPSLPLTKSPQPGPSNVIIEHPNRNVARRKLHIEPMNMQELQKMSESADAENSKEQGDGASLREGLSTILEEDIRELSVRLTRLPHEVVELHLAKSDDAVSRRPSNVDVSFSLRLDPNFSSTPLKMETMKMLGLMPARNDVVPAFVNVRKKDSGNKKNGRSNGLLSPKKEKFCSPEKPSSPKKAKVETNNSRPTRRAKPKMLKEENLRCKKRRS